MDKLLKQFNKISNNTKDKIDYQKYLIFAGIIFANGLFVLPNMKKLYTYMFTNTKAEISHVVNRKLNLVLFRYRT